MDFGNPPDVIRDPPKGWVKRLLIDSKVWLVKENTFAMVTWPFRRNTGICGRLCIHIHSGMEATWYVTEDGNGIDGSKLMLPCHPLPETEAPLANDEQIYTELADLRHQVNELRGMILRIPCCELVIPFFEPIGKSHVGMQLWDVLRGDTDGSFLGTVAAKTIDSAYIVARKKWRDVPPNEYNPNEELVVRPHREGRT